MPAIAIEGHLIRPIYTGIVHVESGYAHRYYCIHNGDVRACTGSGELEQVAWWRKLPRPVEMSVKRVLGGGQ